MNALPAPNSGSCEKRYDQIEDYPSGYPQFAAFVNSHPNFRVFRRFGVLRTRLLLQKQDELSVLQERLEKVDLEEPRVIRLGRLRADNNEVRKQILEDADRLLKDYDDLVERTEKMLGHQPPREQNVRSLRNWVNNTGSLAREETKYLGRNPTELMQFNSLLSDKVSDTATAVILNTLVWVMKIFRLDNRNKNISRDPATYIPPRTLVYNLTQSAIAILLIVVLFVPVVIMEFIASIFIRTGVAVAACAIYILFLSLFSTLKTGTLLY